jgi:hypothetical protein
LRDNGLIAPAIFDSPIKAELSLAYAGQIQVPILQPDDNVAMEFGLTQKNREGLGDRECRREGRSASLQAPI